MRSVVTVYLIGVAAALALLSLGLYLNQPLVSTAAVVVALAAGMLSFLPQLLSSNGLRYGEHKSYFVTTLLPQAGAMTLVAGDGVHALAQDRIAWKIRSQDQPADPGFGETPFFEDMLRPHLRAKTGARVWREFAASWFNAEEQVRLYTQTRRVYDSAFIGKLQQLVREKLGPSFEPVWGNERGWDVRASSSQFTAPLYNAGNFRSRCQDWYLNKYVTQIGMKWEYGRPVAAPEVPDQGIPWRVKMGEGDGRDYIWGGPTPKSIGEIAKAVDEVIDDLRFDEKLKTLYLASCKAEQAAEAAIVPLPADSADAANLLQHGPDIPGTCVYCEAWSPRL